MFTTLIDMLATLIHSTLAEGGDDNNRKHYQNLMKKLKKEIGDRYGPSVQAVRQLLPLSKNTIIEVIFPKQMFYYVHISFVLQYLYTFFI